MTHTETRICHIHTLRCQHRGSYRDIKTLIWVSPLRKTGEKLTLFHGTFHVSTGQFFAGNSYNLDSNHHIIETGNYDAKMTYKKSPTTPQAFSSIYTLLCPHIIAKVIQKGLSVVRMQSCGF